MEQVALLSLVTASLSFTICETMLTDRSQLLENTELLAPADGIVKSIRINTVGGVLRPSEVLLQFLPTGVDVVVEAKFKPSEVRFVTAGLPVTVKLDAYNYSIFGSLKEGVSSISVDALTEDKKQGEIIYYRVQVKITGREFKGSQVNNERDPLFWKDKYLFVTNN